MAGDRGNPWEHDPGPAKNSGWPELFADTPNYRGIPAQLRERPLGAAIIGGGRGHGGSLQLARAEWATQGSTPS